MNNHLSDHPKTAALILAAGSSVRFGRDKLTTLINGKPLISYSLKAFAETPSISSIILVVPPKREEEFRQLVDSLEIPQLTAITKIVTGGSNRHESVQHGLALLPAFIDFVAIHDAARPLITRNQIEHVCTAAYEHGAAALALPVTDTLHRVDRQGYAQGTIDREQLWSVQTPQVFRTPDLIDALNLKTNNFPPEKTPTDEVSLLQQHGIKVALIENGEPNLKVTYPADLKLVEASLCNQRLSHQ